MRGQGFERLVIALLRAEHDVAHALELGAPQPARGDVAHQSVRRLVEIGRHLERQHAFRGEIRHQSFQQRVLVVEPVQRGIGEDHVIASDRRPAWDIAGVPRGLDAGAARLVEHRLGGIETLELGLGPAPREQRGRIARARSPGRSHVWDSCARSAQAIPPLDAYVRPRSRDRSSDPMPSSAVLAVGDVDAETRAVGPCRHQRDIAAMGTRQVARDREPQSRSAARAARAKGWNKLACIAACIPGPLSAMEKLTVLP